MRRANDTGPEQPRRSAWFPRSAALVEAFVLLAVLLAVDQFLLGGNRFAGISPHPFWLVILLPAIQYGTREALVAALMCSVALLAKNVPGQDISQDLYDYVFSLLKLPLLWFAAAVLLGEIRMRHVNERNHDREQLAEIGERASTLASAYERLDERREQLETRVAGQLQTVTTLYEASRALETLEPGSVLVGAMRALAQVMSPEQCSIFTLRKGRLQLVASEGWDADESPVRDFGVESALFREIVGRQRVLCVVREEDQLVLDGQGLLAGPLLDPDSGEVLGMLKIERLDFVQLSSSSLRNFRILCEWVATSYLRALRHQEAERDRVLDGETNLYSRNFLDRQSDYLSGLARRLGFHLSRIDIRLKESDELSPEEQQIVPEALRDTVTEVLRSTDLAFHREQRGYSYAILLPGTPIANCEVVIDKVRDGLKRRLPDWLEQERFSFVVHEIHVHDPEAFAEMVGRWQTTCV